MATKKSASKKPGLQSTMIGTIAGKAGYLAGELAAGKDHLVKIAGDAIESIKANMLGDTEKEHVISKKVAISKAKKVVAKKVRETVKKSVKPAAKKTSPIKKAAKKVAKKAAKKVVAKK